MDNPSYLQAFLEKHYRMCAEVNSLRALPETEQCPTMTRWLLGKNRNRRELVMAILRDMEEAATAMLLQFIMAPEQSLDTRLRLLLVLVELGRPLNPEQWVMVTAAADQWKPGWGTIVMTLLHDLQNPMPIMEPADTLAPAMEPKPTSKRRASRRQACPREFDVGFVLLPPAYDAAGEEAAVDS